MTAIKEKESKAIEQGNFELINGDFTPEDAIPGKLQKNKQSVYSKRIKRLGLLLIRR